MALKSSAERDYPDAIASHRRGSLLAGRPVLGHLRGPMEVVVILLGFLPKINHAHYWNTTDPERHTHLIELFLALEVFRSDQFRPRGLRG